MIRDTSRISSTRRACVRALRSMTSNARPTSTWAARCRASAAQPRIELMLINELDDKFRSLTRRIADTDNKRADSGKVSFTAFGVGAAVTAVLAAALAVYFGH